MSVKNKCIIIRSEKKKDAPFLNIIESEHNKNENRNINS